MCTAVLLVPLRSEEREILSVLLPFVSQYASHLYCNTPPICIAILLGKSWWLWSPECSPTLVRCQPSVIAGKENSERLKKAGSVYHWTNKHYIASPYFSELMCRNCAEDTPSLSPRALRKIVQKLCVNPIFLRKNCAKVVRARFSYNFWER